MRKHWVALLSVLGLVTVAVPVESQVVKGKTATTQKSTAGGNSKLKVQQETLRNQSQGGSGQSNLTKGNNNAAVTKGSNYQVTKGSNYQVTKGNGNNQITKGSNYQVTKGSSNYQVTKGSSNYQVTKGSSTHQVTKGSSALTKGNSALTKGNSAAVTKAK